jgi:hypothetical protein
MTKNKLIKEAKELFADTLQKDNPEYLRGMVELIARCYPIENLTTERNAEEIQNKIVNCFDRDLFYDYVFAHGFGGPSKKGYLLGEEMFYKGIDYSTIAFEVVFLNLTEE